MNKVKKIFIIFLIITMILNLTFPANAENSNSKLEYAIEQATSVTDESMTDIEKALAVHDYIILNCSFDTTYSKRSIYDCLVKRSAVCVGYALAYKEIMNRLNIECEVIISREMNHAWNYIKIDGDWYHVDVTWNDPLTEANFDYYSRVMHDNFMLSDDGIKNTEPPHYDWDTNGLPEADNNFYDDFFWNETESGIFKIDDYWWYIEREEKYPYYYDGKFNQTLAYIMRYNFKTSETEKIYTISSAWYVWNEDSFYTRNFAKLAVNNNLLYFNTAECIYSINVTGTELTIVKRIKNQDGYIYGLTINDNKLCYVIKKTPADEGIFKIKKLS